METAYAERYANVGHQLDLHAGIVFSCLLKQGPFSELGDVACVSVAPVDHDGFTIKLDVHHVKVVGAFAHAFSRDESGSYLYGVLDFKRVNEMGTPYGDPLVRVVIDDLGNCGWRGGFANLHTAVPAGPSEGRVFRRGILHLLRLKVLEYLAEHALKPE